jgi:KaiC/GvpD/RAD55 family RecA-like ATPase
MKKRTQLPKAPTGIQGLDEITGGGLPKGRPTLSCGELRQDADLHGVSGARREGVQRAGRLYGL